MGTAQTSVKHLHGTCSVGKEGGFRGQCLNTSCCNMGPFVRFSHFNFMARIWHLQMYNEPHIPTEQKHGIGLCSLSWWVLHVMDPDGMLTADPTERGNPHRALFIQAKETLLPTQ